MNEACTQRVYNYMTFLNIEYLYLIENYKTKFKFKKCDNVQFAQVGAHFLYTRWQKACWCSYYVVVSVQFVVKNGPALCRILLLSFAMFISGRN